MLRVLASSQVEASVRERKSDYGIVYQPGYPLDTVLNQGTLKSTRVVCVMPRSHALANCPSVRPADLMQQRLLTFGPPSELGMLIDSTFAAAGVRANFRIESSSSLASIFLVDAGLGIALVESSGMAQTFPDLTEIGFEPTIETRIVLVQRADRPLSRIAASFLAHVAQGLSSAS